MTYPSAPWTLKGYAFLTLQLVEIARSRPFIPANLEIVSILPGKTLGGIYLSAYQAGSVLTYNELIVTPALVRYGGKVGSWISHIYVDNEDSLAGGRQIWGLPKEIAQFTWENGRVSVRQGNRQLCSLRYQKVLSTWWTQKVSSSVISRLADDFLLFQSEFNARIGLGRERLEIERESPFAALNLGQPWFVVSVEQMELIAGVPQVVAGH